MQPSATTYDLTETFSGFLRGKFGPLSGSAKAVARAAKSNEDSAKNWLEGRNLPGFKATIELMRADDDLFDLICRLADRDPGTPRLTGAQRIALTKLLEGQ